ncbi:ABC transporter permease [Clostridium algidicarnis]|uniref:ABC transporter permease n=1 Tax=Clostridium algidicarnis TaxID=37659 RepID=UPI001C0DEEBF|nr:ABC transporter permease [Clostridium algidicarnis]MBU3208130.1 ABC transporter permease [Clostridium algidicarnis]MBU3227639.1 ABC transporter permease [Clostridium algidicarnis]MBU3250954.1 ABC transporter permease [Clostridium algidicarnis]
MKKKKRPYRFLYPVVIWMTCFFLIPVALMVLVSFFTRGEFGEVIYSFNVESYIRFMDPLYLNILLKSLIIALFTTAICLVFAYPFAFFIGRSPKKFRGPLIMLVMLPFWTNSLIRTYAWIILLRTEGIINSYLIKLNFISEPLKLLYTNTSVLIGMVYMMFPFMVLPIYSSVEKIDKSLIEAASDLGANPFKNFAKIIWPLTMPGVMAGALLVFVPTLGYFFIPDLMGGSKVILISNLIKNQYLMARDWPFGSAISVILIIVMLIIIGGYFKITKSKYKDKVM